MEGTLFGFFSLRVSMTLAIVLSFSSVFLINPATRTATHPVFAQVLTAAEGRTRYHLSVNLDYENASLTANEVVAYTNNTSVDLTSIFFNVTPAQFKAFTLNGATVNGTKVSPVLEGVTMEVPLPERLTTGKSATVELDFRVNVPKRGGRFGVGNGIIALGNWFPIVAIYNESRTAPSDRPPGWSRHNYVEVGDAFFTDTADYEVSVQTSSPVTIAHTGSLVGKEANRWQIQATGVRDFAMAISNRYQAQSKNVDGVVITAYTLPEHAAAGRQYLEAAAPTVQRMSRLVTPYPGATLHLAEVYAQSSIAMGQEYPGLMFISSTSSDLGGGLDSYLAYLVMHEMAHQWFYGLVGNDQVYQPWLDESLATWFAYHVLRMEAPDLLPNVWQKRVLDPLAESIRVHGDATVDRGIYDFPDELHYYNIVYRKGTLFIEELYKTMGEADFFAALRDYSLTFQDRTATPLAFFTIFQSHTGKNLTPVIAKYFSYSQYKADEPLIATVELPPGPTWSGVVKPKVKTNHPITAASAYVEDRLVWSGDSADGMAVDTTVLKEGDYLITIKVRGGGQIAEQVQRLRVRQGITPVAGPTSSASPPATPVPQEDEKGWRSVAADKAGPVSALAIALILALGITYAIRRSR